MTLFVTRLRLPRGAGSARRELAGRGPGPGRGSLFSMLGVSARRRMIYAGDPRSSRGSPKAGRSDLRRRAGPPRPRDAVGRIAAISGTPTLATRCVAPRGSQGHPGRWEGEGRRAERPTDSSPANETKPHRKRPEILAFPDRSVSIGPLESVATYLPGGSVGIDGQGLTIGAVSFKERSRWGTRPDAEGLSSFEKRSERRRRVRSDHQQVRAELPSLFGMADRGAGGPSFGWEPLARVRCPYSAHARSFARRSASVRG